MQERTNSELDVAAMVMLLDRGMSLEKLHHENRTEPRGSERAPFFSVVLVPMAVR